MPEENRAITINLGTQVHVFLTILFSHLLQVAPLSREQELVQSLPDNAEKELLSYKANSSDGVPFL